MHTRTAMYLTAACAATMLALALTGCAPSAQTPGTGATTGATSATPEATTTITSGTADAATAPAAPTGPVTTPARGSAERTAILVAVRKSLGSGTLTVYQLFAQGGIAIADVRTSAGNRTFVALTGGPDAWSVQWAARFGASGATRSKMQAAVPEMSDALASRLDFKKKVVVAPAAPTLASFESFALASAKKMAAGQPTPVSFTVTAKIAKDASGRWWGNALCTPDVEGLEPIGVWGRYSNGKWTGQIADFSTEDAMSGYFPAEVIPKLAIAD